VYVAGSTDGNIDGQTNSGSTDIFIAKYSVDGTKVWTKLLGTSSTDEAWALTTANDGSVYVAGRTSGNLDGQTSNGNYDANISKYSSDGSKVWTRLWGQKSFDKAYALATGLDGSIYMAGDIDPGTTFLKKYSPDGSEGWTTSLGSGASDYARALTIGSDGAIYLAGQTGGNLDGQTNSRNGDSFVARYNTDGSRAWARLLGTSENDSASAMATGADGSIYVAGFSYGSLDGQFNNGSQDGFLTKYSPEGTRSWTRLVGTSKNDFVTDLSIGVDGAIYLSGITYGNLDGQINNGVSAGFLMRFNPDGTKSWSRLVGTSLIGTSSGYEAHSVATGLDGAIYLAGSGDGDPFLIKWIDPDTTAPAVALSTNKAVLKAGETAAITFSLTELSTDFALDDIGLSGGTLSSFTGSSTSYTATFTPHAGSIANGVVSVASGKFSDAAGNLNVDGADANNRVTIAIDTVLPTISVTSSRASLKGSETATITFALSEASTDFVVGDISVSGGVLSDFTGSGSNYSAVFTPPPYTKGNLSVSVSSNKFSDGVGNLNSDGAENDNTVSISVNIYPDFVVPIADLSTFLVFDWSPIAPGKLALEIWAKPPAGESRGVKEAALSITLDPDDAALSTDAGAYALPHGWTGLVGASALIILAMLNSSESPSGSGQQVYADPLFEASGKNAGMQKLAVLNLDVKPNTAHISPIQVNIDYLLDSFNYSYPSTRLAPFAIPVESFGPTLISSPLDNVTNLDPSSNIVLKFSEAVNPAASKFIRLVNDANTTAASGFRTESATNSIQIEATSSQVTFSADKKTVIINPTADLDLANNFHVEIDAGAFIGVTSLQGTPVLSDPTVINFSTVVPKSPNSLSAPVASDGALSRAMTDDGALAWSRRWLDVEGIGSPTGSSKVPIDLSSSGVALVFKDYDPGGATAGGYDGIKSGDIFISVGGFSKDDYIYIDNQSRIPNNLDNINISNAGRAPSTLQFAGTGLGSILDITLVGSSVFFDTASSFKAVIGASGAPVGEGGPPIFIASKLSKPIDQNISGNVIPENSSVGVTVGVTANASESVDISLPVNYRLVTPDGGPYLGSEFSIHPKTGVVTVSGSIDFETGPTRVIYVAATSDYGSKAISDPIEIAVTNANDAPEGAIVIDGDATQGKVLTIGSTLRDPDGIPSTGLGALKYQWFADTQPIIGGSGASLSLSQSQVGRAITVQATYTDLLGTNESITSEATARVVNLNDPPLGSLVILGTSEQGQTLTVKDSLTDLDGIPLMGLGAIHYEWLADGRPIPDAISGTLKLGQALVGKSIGLRASYVDLLGAEESVNAPATSAVVNVNDAPVGVVTIAGVPAQGNTLSVTNTLGDADGIPTTGIGAITYKWLADGKLISASSTDKLTFT
jgi:hypothetical protein